MGRDDLEIYDLDYEQLCMLHTYSRVDSYKQCFSEDYNPSKEELREKYLENITVSSDLWPKISIIEVALRNNIMSFLDRKITNWYQNGHLLNHKFDNEMWISLTHKTKKQIRYKLNLLSNSIKNIYKKQPDVDKNILVSRLSFGDYVIFAQLLKQVFLINFCLPMDLILFIRKIRNQIAHHENILKKLCYSPITIKETDRWGRLIINISKKPEQDRYSLYYTVIKNAYYTLIDSTVIDPC